jgi:hypothetical protein
MRFAEELERVLVGLGAKAMFADRLIIKVDLERPRSIGECMA